MRNNFQYLSTKATVKYKLKKKFPESEKHFSHRCQKTSNLNMSTLLMSHSQIDAYPNRSWIVQGSPGFLGLSQVNAAMSLLY